MGKTTSVTKPARVESITHSHAGLAERQGSLGAHVCIQRQASGHGVQAGAPSLVRDVLNSPGQALDAGTRAQMEPQFGYDFSGVRVHTDQKAAESAQAVSANAYTAGPHIAFASGRYAPDSPKGQQLIAHELRHVVQQSAGPVPSVQVAEGLSVSQSTDRCEEEARASSRSVGIRGTAPGRDKSFMAKLPPATPAAFPTSIQRSDADLSAAESHTAFGAGIASAVGGLMSGISGIVSAYEAHRQADIAEAALGVSKDQLAEAKEQNRIGREALDTSEGQATTVEGLNATHANLPDLHPDDKSTKRASITIPILSMGVGTEDSAQYRLRLQIDEKNQIRGGNTEEGDAQGYTGGFSGSNASITFSASQVSASPDSLLIQFRGTNVAPKRKGAQRLHGELTVSAPKWESQVKSAPKGQTSPGKGPWASIPSDRTPVREKQPAPPEKPSSTAPPPTHKGAKK